MKPLKTGQRYYLEDGSQLWIQSVNLDIIFIAVCDTGNTNWRYGNVIRRRLEDAIKEEGWKEKP
jgi:hypothetical protein